MAETSASGSRRPLRIAPRYWRRILIVNVVGAFAAFGMFGGFTTLATWRERGLNLFAALVYTNCIGWLMAVVNGAIGRTCAFFTSRQRWAIRLVSIPVLTVAGCLLAGSMLVLVGLVPPDRYWQIFAGSLQISLIVATIACLIVIAYETLRSELEETSLALRTKERDEAEARRLATEAQLASLESRVQPHFLFNTLNSIAALIPSHPKGAERMVEQLASLLRSSLDHESGRLVPLREELAVVRDYLDIERVRFGDRLTYEVTADERLGDVRVPRLSVQTLAENSVKYTVSARREGASLAIRTGARNGHVRIEVEDNGPGFDATRALEGHGLALLRSRLAMTFADRAALTIESRPGRTSIAIDLPLETPDLVRSGPGAVGRT